MPAIRFLLSTASALWLLAAMAAPAAATTCADLPVTARGDPSRFEVLAKAKARGNWRAKVRALPALGAAYADWNKALAADYRCSQKDTQHTCTAVAYPCRD
jgi:ABC-type amino acid transport substrate-binding protein